MAGGRVLKRNAPLVKSVLTLLGAPAVLVHGLDVAAAAVDRVGMPTEDLSGYADRAARELGEQQGHEFRDLGEADKEAVEGIVARSMARLDRRAAVGAALRNNEHLVALLTDDSATTELAAIKAEGSARYHRVVIGRVCVLLQSWLRNSDELPRNTFEGLGEVLDEVIAFRAETRSEFRALHHKVDELTGRMTPPPDQAYDPATTFIRAGDRPQLASAFVVRGEMDQLREALSVSGSATVCALSGMRGVGKSQLASAYAEECERAGWPFVAWVAAANRAQTVAEIAQIAGPLGVADEMAAPEDAARRVIEFLNSKPAGERLIVFDNVEHADDVRGLIPHRDAARVIVTSTQVVSNLGTRIPVDVYTPEQAVEFLDEQTGLKDRDGAAAVADDLGRLPVALTQAATAITTLGYDYREYRAALSGAVLEQVTLRRAGDPYPQTVGAALRIALAAVLNRLEQLDPAVGSAARQVLDALSLLAEAGVPRSWLYTPFGDEPAARRAVGELIEDSLLTPSEDGHTVAMHRLISRVAREDNHASGRDGDADTAAMAVLASVDLQPDGTYAEQRALIEAMSAQTVALLSQEHSHHLTRQDTLLGVARRCASRANEVSDPYSAISLADYVNLHHEALGADHPDTLTSRNNLAYAYVSAGDLARAIPLYEATLTDSERVLGPDHPPP